MSGFDTRARQPKFADVSEENEPESCGLADFILANLEPILMEWERYARSIWRGTIPGPEILRDHAQVMLEAVARNMRVSQTQLEQSSKSKGRGEGGEASDQVDFASNEHADARFRSGFDMQELVNEYRALRASVIRLWQKSVAVAKGEQLEELIRFNEAIDQLLTQSIVTYANHVSQSREVFLAILGHDLRTPLFSVKMLAEMLAKTGRLDEPSLKMAAGIASSTNVMSGMINDLLDFTGTRLGSRMHVSPEPLDLAPLCVEVLDEMRAAYPGRTFSYQAQGDLTGHWDGLRIRQMLSNLLGNAVHHGFTTTPIALSATGSTGEVRLAVANQGTPIPQDQQETIFEPMKQGNGSGGQRPHGSIGLGLYIAREVATAHDGSIEVRSDEAATVFTAILPRDSRQPGKDGSC
jgi:signal transduction histidine kinase